MEQRVSLVTLCVRDLAVSRSFSRRLGWTESPPSNDSVAFFQCGGLVFGWWGREALMGDTRLDGPGHGFSNTCLAHNVRTKAEVDTTLGQAQTAGATILKPAQDVFWGGYSGYFADPDGFAWEVAWNPRFEILPDGGIKLPE